MDSSKDSVDPDDVETLPAPIGTATDSTTARATLDVGDFMDVRIQVRQLDGGCIALELPRTAATALGGLLRALATAVEGSAASSRDSHRHRSCGDGNVVRDIGTGDRAWRNAVARARIALMTGRAHKVLEEALSLSEDERLDLAEQLLSSLPADREWLAELERRARRALADPSGGEAWEVVERRLDARFASR